MKRGMMKEKKTIAERIFKFHARKIKYRTCRSSTLLPTMNNTSIERRKIDILQLPQVLPIIMFNVLNYYIQKIPTYFCNMNSTKKY